jgi:hypothetical protein
MSTFVEDSGTGGMGDGNPSIVNGIETNLPLYEFDLHNPDIRNDYGSYYGSHHKGDKHRRGHGITIYHNESILDAWWSSNNKIQPLKPVFWLGTYPKLVMFNFLLHTNTSNSIRFINKKNEGYIVCDEYTAYGKFGDKSKAEFPEYPKPTNYVTHESGYLLRRSKLFR